MYNDQQKFQDFDVCNLRSDLNFCLLKESTLDELVMEYKSVAKECMDKHAPWVTNRVTKQKHELLYKDGMIELKRGVRRRGRVWCKYIEDHQ